MGHYDCKSCGATPYEEHSPNCERFGTKPPPTKGTNMNQIALKKAEWNRVSGRTDMNQIEKVARAICAADPEIRRGDAEHIVQQLVNTEWRNYTDAAKAAIAVMHPPAPPQNRKEPT